MGKGAGRRARVSGQVRHLARVRDLLSKKPSRLWAACCLWAACRAMGTAALGSVQGDGKLSTSRNVLATPDLLDLVFR